MIAWLHGPDADVAGAVVDDIELGVSSVAQLRRAGEAAAAASGRPL